MRSINGPFPSCCLSRFRSESWSVIHLEKGSSESRDSHTAKIQWVPHTGVWVPHSSLYFFISGPRRAILCSTRPACRFSVVFWKFRHRLGFLTHSVRFAGLWADFTIHIHLKLFQNGRQFSILLFPCKLALMASLSNVKFKRIFNLERGHKGQFAWKQKNTKMAAILE